MQSFQQVLIGILSIIAVVVFVVSASPVTRSKYQYPVTRSILKDLQTSEAIQVASYHLDLESLEAMLVGVTGNDVINEADYVHKTALHYALSSVYYDVLGPIFDAAEDDILWFDFSRAVRKVIATDDGKRVPLLQMEKRVQSVFDYWSGTKMAQKGKKDHDDDIDDVDDTPTTDPDRIENLIGDVSEIGHRYLQQSTVVRDIVSLLLEKGANANLIDNEKRRAAIHYASDVKCLGCDMTVFSMILNASSESSLLTPDFDGYLPIHLAMKQGNFEMVQMILERYPLMAFERERSGSGFDVVELAIIRNAHFEVEWILDHCSSNASEERMKGYIELATRFQCGKVLFYLEHQ